MLFKKFKKATVRRHLQEGLPTRVSDEELEEMTLQEMAKKEDNTKNVLAENFEMQAHNPLSRKLWKMNIVSICLGTILIRFSVGAEPALWILLATTLLLLSIFSLFEGKSEITSSISVSSLYWILGLLLSLIKAGIL